jgi:hypothetical protein
MLMHVGWVKRRERFHSQGKRIYGKSSPKMTPVERLHQEAHLRGHGGARLITVSGTARDKRVLPSKISAQTLGELCSLIWAGRLPKVLMTRRYLSSTCYGIIGAPHYVLSLCYTSNCEEHGRQFVTTWLQVRHYGPNARVMITTLDALELEAEDTSVNLDSFRPWEARTSLITDGESWSMSGY